MTNTTRTGRIEYMRRLLKSAKAQMDCGFGGKERATRNYLVVAAALERELVSALDGNARTVASVRGLHRH